MFDEDFIDSNLNNNMYDNIGITILTGIKKAASPSPPTPISDICFPASTPIKTDQGNIPIEKIDINIHTIRGNKIVAVTKTISKNNYLVCFEKHSLKQNYPNKRTFISKEHKIYHYGKLTEAYKLIDYFSDIKKIYYDEVILYNILMETYSTINVNNLICETLHPNNIIAKIFSSNISDEDKNKIIIINNSIMEKKNKLNTNRLNPNRFNVF
jgi:hypothetical protein